MSQQNKLLCHLKMFVLETFTAAAFPSPSKAWLAQGWDAALSQQLRRWGWDQAHGSSRRLRQSDAHRGRRSCGWSALPRMLWWFIRSCSARAQGCSLFRCLARTALTPSLICTNRGSRGGQSSGWPWLTSVGFCILVVARIAPLLC